MDLSVPDSLPSQLQDRVLSGYHNDSKVSFLAPSQSKQTASFLNNSQTQQNLGLSSLSMPGSLSRFWGGLACACCY